MICLKYLGNDQWNELRDVRKGGVLAQSKRFKVIYI